MNSVVARSSLAVVLAVQVACAGATSRTAMTPPDALDPRTRAALVEAREAVWRAYFQGDSARLVRILPEQMVGMGQTRADIIADAQSFVREGGRFLGITFTNDEFFVHGDVAVVYSDYHVQLERGGKPAPMMGRAIELFVKRDGYWINPSWHLDSKEQ